MSSKIPSLKTLPLAFVLLSLITTSSLGQGGGRPTGGTTHRLPPGGRLPARIKVTIATDPSNCQVMIDGRTNGETNAQGELTVELPAGRHKVRITRAGFVQQERSISAVPGGTREQFILAPALVSVVVLTEPPESEVYVDGSYRGLSRTDGVMSVDGIGFGDHIFRVQRRGYVRQEQTIKVGANNPAVRIRLVPDPVAQRIHVIDENLSADRLTDALGIFAELYQASPNHPDLPPALDRIQERLQARTANTLARLGTRGLLITADEAMELRNLYDSIKKFKPDDASITSFSDYWTAKYCFLKAKAALTAPERDDNLQKGQAALARLNSAGLRNAYLLYDIGWMYSSSNDRVQATRNFNTARSADSSWGLPLFALGLFEMSAADQMSVKKDRQAGYERALGDFNQAIALNARLYEAFSLRGIAYASLNKHREAIASAQQAVTINALSGFAHFALGYVYFQKGKGEYANADREFMTALAATTDPVDADTRKRIQELRGLIARSHK